MNQDEILQYLKDHDYLWQYLGEPNPDKPHALLTTGLHSNGYVNVGDALKQDPKFRENVARALIDLNTEVNGPDFTFDWVVGADTSSTDLAYDVARLGDADNLEMRKDLFNDVRCQRWFRHNPPLRSGDIILHVEDLITTSFSALQVRRGINEANPNIKFAYAPYLLTVVDRSDPDTPVKNIDTSELRSLVRLEIRNFTIANCPYCAVGSMAIPPKKDNNWMILTGKI